MTVYWGCDTASDTRTVIEAVHNAVGAFPSFVGRYLANYALTTDEAAWLHTNGARIMPIWNGALSGDVGSNQAHGQEHGQLASAAAKRLGIPAGVWLPVDIEAGWVVTAEFIAGYNAGCHAEGYVGGAYLNALEQNHADAWIGARKQSTIPAFVYSSEPEPYALLNTVLDTWYDFTQTPLGAAGTGVAAWQYGESELNGSVDYDVCTAACYETLLWAPTQAPPLKGRVYHLVETAGLKQRPDHTSNLAVDVRHDGVTLHTGATVTATGDETPMWIKVTVPNSPVWGWLQKKSVR